MNCPQRAIRQTKARQRRANRLHKRAAHRQQRARQLQQRQQLHELLDWFLGTTIFADWKAHGNTKWQPRLLVCLTLLWCFSECRCLTDAFQDAQHNCRLLFVEHPSLTYQGLMNALTTWSNILFQHLWRQLQQRMKEVAPDHWKLHGFVPLAVDGSRSKAPRTLSNEQAFCAPNYGQGATARYRKKKTKGMRRRQNQRNKPQPPAPQVWITMIWHMGLRLPFRWRLGPSNASERDHLKELLKEQKYPQNTLFCGDAGFVGFPLWSAILGDGQHFLVRVGANVSLLREHADYQLVHGGQVLCWPQNQQHKQPPLRLRLAKVKVGKTWMYLLTDVLDERRLIQEQLVEFYKMRWGIEVEFRGLKQTLEKAKLRCRNAARVEVELNWSILAMAVVELFALKEQSRGREAKPAGPLKPSRRSLAQTMRAIRRHLRHLGQVAEAGEDLREQLGAALTDSYQRKSSKKARCRPPNPDKKKLGKPKLRTLTTKQRQRLKQMEQTP